MTRGRGRRNWIHFTDETVPHETGPRLISPDGAMPDEQTSKIIAIAEADEATGGCLISKDCLVYWQ